MSKMNVDEAIRVLPAILMPTGRFWHSLIWAAHS